MENDGKIYITISDRRFGTNKAEADEQNQVDKQKSEKKDSKGIISDYAKHQFFNMIQSQAKQAVNYTVSNIGNFTGNYQSQRHIQESMQILQFGTDIAMSAIAGAKYGGAWGAVAGVGVALIGKGINFAQEYYAGYVENARTNRDIKQLRTRAGLNGSNNGSRGTDQ